MKNPFRILRKLNPFATRELFGMSTRVYESERPKRWRRIGGGEDDIDMSPALRTKAMRLSRRLYQESPTYGAVVDRYLEHVVGDGIRVELDDAAAQTWLDEQFAKPENRFHETIGQRLTRLAVDGEYLLQVSSPARGRGKPSGNVYLGRMDLERVAGIEVSPFNHDAIRKILISREADKSAEPIVVPVLEPECELVTFDAQGAEVGGDVQVESVGNRVVGMDLWRARTLGRRSAPLFSRIIDKSASLDETFENLTRKVEFLNRFWLQIKLEGKNITDMDDPKVQAYLRKTLAWAESAEPGAAFATSGNVSVDPVVPDLKLIDAKALYDIGLDMILGAYAVPRMWFSSGGDTNRATAAEQGSPIHRAISSWQTMTCKPAIENMVRFVLWIGQLSGVAGLAKGHEIPFDVVMADIATRDSLRDAQECSNVILMLNEAKAAQIITAEEHQAIGRATLGAKAYGDHMEEQGPDLTDDEQIIDLDDPRFGGAQPEDDGEVPADAGAAAGVQTGVPATLAG